MSKRTFNVNTSLYPVEIIQEWIAAFEGYTISHENGVITIDDEDPETVFKELLNYILSLYSETIIWA